MATSYEIDGDFAFQEDFSFTPLMAKTGANGLIFVKMLEGVVSFAIGTSSAREVAYYPFANSTFDFFTSQDNIAILSAGSIKVHHIYSTKLLKTITTSVDSMMTVHTGGDNLFIFG